MDAVTEKGDPRTSKKAIDKASDKSGRVDSIVTARVPAEIKKQGNAVLREIGSTPTELVNAAYRYVLKERELPKEASPLAGLAGQHRILSPEQKERVRNRVRRTTLNAPADWGSKSFKELLAEARDERYARLS